MWSNALARWAPVLTARMRIPFISSAAAWALRPSAARWMRLLRKAEDGTFFGFRTKAHAYGMTQAPCRVVAVSDDGSIGEKALVTKPLLAAIEEKRPDLIMACGPTPMLAAVQKIANEMGIPCQLSLEERMGCAIGACLGCNVKINLPDGSWTYKRVCKDGPVFTSEEVAFGG